jgi:archaetidylinositol phosphate synthase
METTKAKKKRTKKAKKAASHQRINDIFLGPIERPLIAWLVARLPSWVMPDHLTLTGLFGSFVIAAGYILSNQNPAFLWLASFGFIVNWFGDSLDGNLARHRKIERPRYGFFIDHTLDTLSEAIIMLSLGLSPYVNFHVASIMLITYLMMSVLVYISTYVRGVFRISYGKLGPTEARAIAISVNTGIFFGGNPVFSTSFGTFSVFDFVLMFLAGLVTVIFLYNIVKQGTELSREEAPRKNNSRGPKT